jgi:Uma2 family endonuclease
MTRHTTLTYRDYEALPDDGRRYEIHDGELSVTPAPSPQHQLISGALFYALRRWVERYPGGRVIYSPLDVILADTTIVQPDIVYLAPDRLERISRRGIEGAPTLAVEVLSPSTRQIDRITKTRLYAHHGVPFLWLVDPDARSIEAFELENARYVLLRTVSGADAVDVPPFTDLGLVPDTLWS